MTHESMRARHRSVGYPDDVSWLAATVYDITLDAAERACLSNWRSELMREFEGNVLELGAGTGLNLDHYPAGVSAMTLVEPDRSMRLRLERRLLVGSRTNRATVVDAFSESLPLENASFDIVVGTLVLCSVKSVERTLAEARRVLKPGGTLAFIEHVAAPQRTFRRRSQIGLEPIWSAVSGGCHLVRDPRSAIEEAGFEPVEITEREILGVPWFLKSAIAGTWRLR